MKLIEKLKYQKKAAAVEEGNDFNMELGTLELQLKYIDEGGNHVNISCGVLAGSDSLPSAIISRIKGFRQMCTLRSRIKFPEQVKVDLSKNEIDGLFKASGLLKSVENMDGAMVLNTEKGSYDQEFMKRVVRLMKENLSDDSYWVDDLACDMHVSRSTLFRKLKGLTGMSPQEFMRTERLKCAAGLLEQGPSRISDVAYQVGFSDPNYFSKCFRKFFGKSPSTFIEECAPVSGLQMAI
ncbi:helix-turn-helix domain-containing protein [Pseudozobellia thermophila]|uniref:AraC-type DNA-binding protein n=1 Tax=Pseudozobellia thermophila TaxID=192903 RepID=A0A1M6GGG0_9FLAO|nr:AraC family transcriptional regulator [Pseudozobellia thermophila]SHJ08988.1 AraC-type DNA-binding protein [Pseudozobellia thermophila]